MVYWVNVSESSGTGVVPDKRLLNCCCCTTFSTKYNNNTTENS